MRLPRTATDSAQGIWGFAVNALVWIIIRSACSCRFIACRSSLAHKVLPDPGSNVNSMTTSKPIQLAPTQSETPADVIDFGLGHPAADLLPRTILQEAA